MADIPHDRLAAVTAHDRVAFRSLAETLTLPQAACLVAASLDGQFGRFRMGRWGVDRDFCLESPQPGGPVLRDRTVTTLVARRMVEVRLGRLHITEHGRQVLEGIDDLRRPFVGVDEDPRALDAQAN